MCVCVLSSRKLVEINFKNTHTGRETHIDSRRKKTTERQAWGFSLFSAEFSSLPSSSSQLGKCTPSLPFSLLDLFNFIYFFVSLSLVKKDSCAFYLGPFLPDPMLVVDVFILLFSLMVFCFC
jgi:hypothetical protein